MINRKIKNRKRITKDLRIIRRRLLISILLIVALILISIILRNTATGQEAVVASAISENVSMIKSSDEIWVPVPKGYSASKIPGETSVKSGFVIYEGENIDWSFLENSTGTIESKPIGDEISKIDSSLEDESSISIDTAEENTDINLETENNKEVVTSGEKNEYMSNVLLGEDEINNAQSDSNEDNNKLENLVELPIIDNMQNEEIYNKNQILNSDENQPSAIADDTGEGQEEPSQLEKDIFNLQCSTNQYVWVPVDDVSELYGVDESGKLWGKLRSYDRDNTHEVMDCNWMIEKSDNKTVMNIINKIKWREPDIIKDTDTESYYLYAFGRGITKYEFLQNELEQFFYKTIESIKRYGGFYIGRYETGGITKTAVVRKMDTNISSDNWTDNWYKIYEKCKTLGISNPAVTTSMIWGTLWDKTLNWIVNTSDDKTMMYNAIYVNSNSFANYPYSEFYYYSDLDMTISKKEIDSGIKIPTGSAEYTKINNIYDMAGNVFDWTLEAYRYR